MALPTPTKMRSKDVLAPLEVLVESRWHAAQPNRALGQSMRMVQPQPSPLAEMKWMMTRRWLSLWCSCHNDLAIAGQIFQSQLYGFHTLLVLLKSSLSKLSSELCPTLSKLFRSLTSESSVTSRGCQPHQNLNTPFWNRSRGKPLVRGKNFAPNNNFVVVRKG